MADVGTIRDGIQTRLLTITGLRGFDVVKGRFAAPCAWVRPENYTQDDQDGDDAWVLTIDLYVSLNSMRAAQDALDTYLPGGTKDVKAAVEGDRDLAGTVDSVTCDFVDGSYGIKEINVSEDTYGRLFLGCEFRVEVYA